MVKKGVRAIAFLKGDLATLKIPSKLCLVGELLRLLVRIIKCVCGHQYSLMLKHGQLQGLYLGSNLNSVDPSSTTTLGSGISIKEPKKGQKLVLITLSKAIQLENQRGTVANAQRMGRKGN
jgi:hypothetical protein